MRKHIVNRMVIVTSASDENNGVPRKLVPVSYTVLAECRTRAGRAADAAKLAAEAERGHWQDPAPHLASLGVR